MHEGYVLDTVPEGIEVRLEGMRLSWGDELGRPFFHDYKGELASVWCMKKGVWDVERGVDDIQYG
jgi:hypothetical protein